MNSRKGLKLGLLASAFLFLVILAIPLFSSITAYDGYCVSFEPPKRQCTMMEYLVPAFILSLMFLAFGKPLLSIPIVISILALPLLGYLIGKRYQDR